MAAVSKKAVPVLFKVTPAGEPFNPVKTAVVEPSKGLFAPSGNTNMYSVSGAPGPTRVKKTPVE
jgi:hypothetical protein